MNHSWFDFIDPLCLTHWGRVRHICVSKLPTIGSDNGLLPGRRQAIIWTNAGILLIGPLGTKFSEILIEIHTFSFKKMHLKILSRKWRPFCLGLNVLICTHQNVNEDMIRFELFLAATKQLYEWFSPSVRPSVCPSVCPSVRLSVTPFWLCSHHPIIMKFSGVITSDKSDVHAKGQGQLNRFRTVTPVWIHIWWWDDAYSLIMLRRGALLFLKVIRQISRSHGSKNRRFDPDWAFLDCNSSLNSPMATKWCTKLEVA